MAAGAPNERIRGNAFSATPKAKPLDLFGRPANPGLPPSADNKPEAFHLYPMRQAIEEGFILDVLQTYPHLQHRLADRPPGGRRRGGGF